MNEYTKTDEYWYLYYKREWFMSIFKEQVSKEGWNIIYSMYKTANYRVVNKYINNLDFSKDNKRAIEFAREYGWIVDNKGNIIDHDTNKLTRNRHLLTANELGLL